MYESKGVYVNHRGEVRRFQAAMCPTLDSAWAVAAQREEVYNAEGAEGCIVWVEKKGLYWGQQGVKPEVMSGSLYG